MSEDEKEVVFLQGDEACCVGAILAGCKLFAGYPITPATEISEVMAERLPKTRGCFVQGEDELASLAMVIGASQAGWKAMTATSGNGISLMQEEIGYAAMSETPCVIVDVQRAGPGTGAATKSMQGDVYQVRYGSNADYAVIAFAPNSPQEMLDHTLKAFNLSEKYRVPTFVLSDEIVGHMRERVEIPPEDQLEIIERKKPKVPPKDFVPFKTKSDKDVPPMPAFGQGYQLPVSGFSRTETGAPSVDYQVHSDLVRRLWNKIEENVDDITETEELYLEENPPVVLTSYGSVSRAAKRALSELRRQGYPVGFLRLKTLWPFPDKVIEKVTDYAKTLLIPEMNMGKMAREVRRAADGKCQVLLLSKPGIELPHPKEITKKVKGVLE